MKRELFLSVTPRKAVTVGLPMAATEIVDLITIVALSHQVYMGAGEGEGRGKGKGFRTREKMSAGGSEKVSSGTMG